MRVMGVLWPWEALGLSLGLDAFYHFLHLMNAEVFISEKLVTHYPVGTIGVRFSSGTVAAFSPI